MKKILSLVLALGMAVSTTLVTSGCSFSNFVSEADNYLNQVVPSVNAILAILNLFGVTKSPVAPAKVGQDVANVETLLNDLASAPFSSQAAIYANIQTAEGVLNQDLADIFSVAQVSDKQTQAKVTALISLVEAAIAEGFALVPAPSPSPKLELAKHASAVYKFESKDYVGSFNKILTAKTGNESVDKATGKLQLHKHGKFVHIITFGLAK